MATTVRRTAAVTALAVPLLGLSAAAPRPAEAQAEIVSFEATAVADGVRIDIDVASAPLTKDVIDAGGPVAQARVNALGVSQAFASLPYPGDVALGAAPLVGSLTGLPSPPPYPLIAASDAATTPESSVEQPGYALTASSSLLRSAATLHAGGSAGTSSAGRTTAVAEASLDEATGTVVGLAESTTESATFEGVLRIGSTRATAKATRPPAGDPTYESSFLADGLTVAGLPVGVGADGLLLPGSAAPVPDSEGLSPLLDGAGITLRYLEPVVGESSVVSAGLAVSMTRDLPSFGRSVVTYTFGRAVATAASRSTPSIDVGGGLVTSTPAGAPPVGSRPPAVPAIGTPAAAPSTPTAPAPTGSAPTAGEAVPIGDIAFPTASATAFYLVLVVGALVAGVALAAARIFGVRLAWA